MIIEKSNPGRNMLQQYVKALGLHSFLIAALASVLFPGCNPNADINTPGSNPGNSNAIFERGEQLSADLITGKAWHNKLMDEDSVYTTAIGVEEFEPGSRNVWHSHPGGQIIIILDGVGYHQIKGEPVQVLRKGQIAKCPPGVLHWHGASKDSSVTQIYILPNTEKGLADWSDRVTDEQYNNVKTQ